MFAIEWDIGPRRKRLIPLNKEHRMKRRLLIFLSLCLLLTPTLADAEQKSNWPHWRGPNGNGLVDQGDPPVEWDETRNIRWKVKIPGTGYATPLVWGERIFVQDRKAHV